MDKELTASEIIDALGGTSHVAQLFDITPPSVCEWRTNGIPKARMMYIRLAFKWLFEKKVKKGKRKM